VSSRTRAAPLDFRNAGAEEAKRHRSRGPPGG
jgi:hypothetical protein